MSGTEFGVLDSDELRPFHRKVTLLSAAGMFLDGYDLAVIAVALPVLKKQWDISAGWEGALAASAVVGMLVGALVFGRLTDRLGRKKMYLIDLICFFVFAALTAVSQDLWQLLAFRFLLGVGLGADYSISSTLLAEFAPAHRRGTLMCRLGATWFVGSAAAYLAGLVFSPLGDSSWRWMLLLGAVFALVVIYLRSKIPESPRWLQARGRADEASAVLARFTRATGEADEPGDAAHRVSEAEEHAPFRRLFSGRMLRWTTFCCGFWFMYTLAYYGITIYTPTIMKEFTTNSLESSIGSMVVALLGVAGAVAGVATVDRVGRRPLIITAFSGLVVALAVLALIPSPPLAAVVVLLAVAVLFANSGPGILDFVYPTELFPTPLRASGTGLAAAVSRAGGVIGTLLFPKLVDAWGLGNALWLFVACGVLGVGICVWLAPETKGERLEDINRRLIGADELDSLRAEATARPAG
ncbi:MAG TPA: MFS transporter [Streptosporangiaceae bacterium]